MSKKKDNSMEVQATLDFKSLMLDFLLCYIEKEPNGITKGMVSILEHAVSLHMEEETK